MGFGELFELTEPFDWLIRGGAGWRYLLSKSYRRQVHQRWREQSRLAVAIEIFWVILALLFTTFLAAGVVYLIVELSK
jgi:predicted membrane-bound mannosyltransferase